MDETEHIAIGETCRDVGGTETVRRRVSLPTASLLTGRGCIIGCSGTDTSVTAGSVAETLLEAGCGLCIVDECGQFYGLRREYELLHVGGDDTCDVQLSSEQAGSLASLTIEEGLPVHFDLSSFQSLHQGRTILGAFATELLSSMKESNQQYLLFVDAIEQFLPNTKPTRDWERALATVATEGGNHGMGLCGISTNSTEVDRSFAATCDWLICHRLSFRSDLQRFDSRLDSSYSADVESLGDREAILTTSWDGTRRVQVDQPASFDPATSVSSTGREQMVSVPVDSDIIKLFHRRCQHSRGSADQQRIRSLEDDVDEKAARIRALESRLNEAQKFAGMAESIVDDLSDCLDGDATDGIDGRQVSEQRLDGSGRDETELVSIDFDDTASTAGQSRHEGSDTPVASDEDNSDTRMYEVSGSEAEEAAADGFGALFGDDSSSDANSTQSTSGNESHESVRTAGTNRSDPSSRNRNEYDEEPAPVSSFSADELLAELRSIPEGHITENVDWEEARETVKASLRYEPDFTHEESPPSGLESEGLKGATGPQGTSRRQPGLGRNGTVPDAVAPLSAEIEALSSEARKMLAIYIERGPTTPMNARFTVSGEGDRTEAYALNRELRRGGFIEHVGQGYYESRLQETLSEALSSPVDEDALITYLQTGDASLLVVESTS